MKLEDDTVVYGYYGDDIAWLENYVKHHYPRQEFVVEKTKEEVSRFRKSDSEYYASQKALINVNQNPGKDPMVVLEDLVNEFAIEETFAKQSINTNHYKICRQTIEQLIEDYKKEKLR